MNAFERQKQREEQARPLVNEIYERLGIGYEYKDDKKTQLSGVDVVVEWDGFEFKIEQKFCFQHADTNNFFFERWSNRELKTPGWWAKAKHQEYDYLHYICVKEDEVYFTEPFPKSFIEYTFEDLRLDWMGAYLKATYLNGFYTTSGAVVPHHIVLNEYKSYRNTDGNENH